MSHIKYQPHIDGLRALAVLAVVFFHALPEFTWGGFIGVDIFFVISGYLISKILLNDLSLQKFSVLQFYIRRIRRIFPSLILVFLFCLLVGSCILMPDEYQSLATEMMAGIAFASNLLFMQQVGYFDLAAETKPLLHLWSLGVEEQFYIFWPLILLGLYQVGLKNAEKLILALLVLSLICGVYLTNYRPEIAFYSPLTRAWELLLGALLATQQANSNDYLGRYWIKSQVVNAMGILGLLMILSAFVLIDNARDFPGFWAILPALGAVLIIKAGGSKTWFGHHVLANKYIVLIGLISYPLYLWHWPLLSFFHIVEGKTPSVWLRLLAIALAFVMAWISYHFVERPIRTHKNTKLVAVLLLLMMLVMVFFAYKINEQQGYKYRMMEGSQFKQAFVSTKQWLDSERKNCQSKFPEQALCFTNAQKNQHEQVVFLGDSHVDVLAAGVIKSYPDIYAASFMAFGCPPFIGVNRLNKNHLMHCGDNTQQILEKFKDVPNQTIVLNARYAMYESGKGFILPNQRFEEPEDVRIQFSEQTLVDSEVNYKQVFAIGLRNTLEVLSKQNKAIVFAYQTPELGFDPRSCVKRPFRVTEATQCKISRHMVDARQAGYRSVVQSVLKDFPNVITYDPVSVLCDKDYCYGGKGQNLFYKDDDHISIVGSALIAPSLKDAILKAQKGRQTSILF